MAAEYPDGFGELASFQTGNTTELTEKLRRLLALQPEERMELAEAARKAVVDRWSWTGVANRLLQPFA